LSKCRRCHGNGNLIDVESQQFIEVCSVCNGSGKVKNTVLGFKITVVYECLSMIDSEALEKEFNNSPLEAYKCISDNFNDSVHNFNTNPEKIIKVEVWDNE